MKYALYTITIVFAIIGLVFTFVFLGMRFKLFDVRGSIAERNAFFTSATSSIPWVTSPEWSVVRGGLLKDREIIERVSKETGVPSRMIASIVVPEQIRFFTSEREIFKSYFEPLKILGSLSQFSLGVSGIKQETAMEIELRANETMAKLISYASTTNHDAELYNRLTDPRDHYYSYLYTALFVREIENEWKSSGFDISGNAGVVATLFNLGFSGSKPKADPHVGGAPITVGGATFLYGALSASFYDSDELVNEFPR